jgi:hypothetical protein
MGNRIASSFVNSLRRSLSGTTLFSQTSANPPLMVSPSDLPGVARAWVSFYGIVPRNQECPIYTKSSNVVGVSANTVAGDYTIEFRPNTFTNVNYMINGSVEADTLIPVSAANTFFVKGSGAGGISQQLTRVRIQTVNTSLSTGHIPAFGRRVNLFVYR